MRIWARKNRVGWIHFWTRADGYAEGEASEHFCNGRIDPLWRETALGVEAQAALDRGELVGLEDPGYFGETGSAEESSR
jgi:hypothetical protein